MMALSSLRWSRMSVSTWASKAWLVSPEVYISYISEVTYDSHLAQFFEGRIHALLHDEQLLLFLLHCPSHLAVLLVDTVQKIVNLQLFGLQVSGTVGPTHP